MTAEQKKFAIAALRRSSFRWHSRFEAKNLGRKQMLNSKGRLVWHYTCAMCPPDVWHIDADVRMDHIAPVVDPKQGWKGFDSYIERLYVEVAGWQRLCNVHHKIKTKEESAIRKLVRNS